MSRMSAMARRIVDFPEALAPKMPATGTTLTGAGLPAIARSRAIPSSDSLVPSSERFTSSQYERTFRALKDRSAFVAASEPVALVIGQFSRKNLAKRKIT